MNPIRILSLYSGSSGNAFLIATPRCNLLIDAGKSARQLCRCLNDCGITPDRINAILLTHEHNDHTSALSVFLKHHPCPVHLPLGCVSKLEADPAVAPHLYPHPPIWNTEFDGIRVSSFPTPHDSHASVGYRLELSTANGSLSVGYATDLGYVSREVEVGLRGCDAVILESNHDPDLLMNGAYPYALKQRIASRHGHLSNTDSAAFAASLSLSGTKSFLLAHLSQENNTPEIALDACMSAIADDTVPIHVAAPDRITELPIQHLMQRNNREVPCFN